MFNICQNFGKIETLYLLYSTSKAIIDDAVCDLVTFIKNTF